ncbi:hypothetical protein ACIGO9_31010 [Nocardia asteroides]|uniref:hypothetical protein n=1 Tax=Nocardia asteroides TaxID=1824 RepID=UPI0037CACF93
MATELRESGTIPALVRRWCGAGAALVWRWLAVRGGGQPTPGRVSVPGSCRRRLRSAGLVAVGAIWVLVTRRVDRQTRFNPPPGRFPSMKSRWRGFTRTFIPATTVACLAIGTATGAAAQAPEPGQGLWSQGIEEWVGENRITAAGPVLLVGPMWEVIRYHHYGEEQYTPTLGNRWDLYFTSEHTYGASCSGVHLRGGWLILNQSETSSEVNYQVSLSDPELFDGDRTGCYPGETTIIRNMLSGMADARIRFENGVLRMTDRENGNRIWFKRT